MLTGLPAAVMPDTAGMSTPILASSTAPLSVRPTETMAAPPASATVVIIGTLPPWHATATVPRSSMPLNSIQVIHKPACVRQDGPLQTMSARSHAITFNMLVALTITASANALVTTNGTV